jgi:hypothetical protein
MSDYPVGLSSLLEMARLAGPADRIEYRDAIAGHGAEAIGPMSRWVRDAGLGAFAVRVLRGITDQGHGDAVVEAVVREWPNVTSPPVKSDLEELLRQVQSAGRPAAAPYQNTCWNCNADVDSRANSRCPKCRMFVCRCGECMCGYG